MLVSVKQQFLSPLFLNVANLSIQKPLQSFSDSNQIETEQSINEV